MSPLVADPAGVALGVSVALGRLGGPMLAAAALLLVPGLLGAVTLKRRGALADAADVLAAAPGVGVLAVALGWWAADLVGLPVGPPLLAATLGAGGLAGALLVFRTRSAPRMGAAWLLLLALLCLLTRLAVVRDLALPAWVDGVHHTYITRLLLDHGGVPTDYRPLLDFGPFAYHFGFHALAASAAELSGAPPPDAVLAAGQLLSACAVPAAFLLARLYGASALGALAAGAVAGLVSMMPAYYVSWSRFTELAGLIAAPSWLLLARRAGSGPGAAAVAGLGAVGLLLVHPRVAALAGLLVLVDRLVQPGVWPGRSRWLPLAPLVAVLAAAPWLARLFGSLVPRLGVPTPGIETANALDLSAISTYQDPWLYGLAAAALVGGLTVGSLGAWTLLAWAALVFVAANPALLGLPGTYMLSNSSVVIALWLPASAVIGCGLGALADAVAGRLNPQLACRMQRVAPVVLLLTAAALTRPPLAALNPGTILATPRDRAVLQRLRDVLPPDALVAVAVREWQLRTFMGSDAGYWIGVITPGRAIAPPLLYGLGPPDHARAISERLARWEAAARDGQALASQMREMGALWLFLGERGAIDPTALTPDAGFGLVLEDGPVRLYRLR